MDGRWNRSSVFEGWVRPFSICFFIVAQTFSIRFETGLCAGYGNNLIPFCMPLIRTRFVRLRIKNPKQIMVGVQIWKCEPNCMDWMQSLPFSIHACGSLLNASWMMTHDWTLRFPSQMLADYFSLYPNSIWKQDVSGTNMVKRLQGNYLCHFAKNNSEWLSLTLVHC